MSSSVCPSPPASPLTATPPAERRDPFRSIIKPFLRRGTSTTFDAIKDHLRLNSTVPKPPPPPPPQPPRSSPSRISARQPQPSTSSSASLPQQTHTRQKISRARQAATLKLHALSALSSRAKQSTATSSNSSQTENSSLIDLDSQPNRTSTDPNSTIHHHHHHHHPPISAFTTTSVRPASSIVSMTSSIHSLLTQPALVTLAQLAPAQLLSGVHSSCFGSSDAFRIFDEYELHQQQQQQHETEPPTATTTTSSNPPSRHLPTTIEQLSASSIALPITSISSIWRLLNCIEWINLKERQLITDDPNPKISYHAYSTHTPTLTPSSSQQQQQEQQTHNHLSQGLGSFDLANTLQHVGDILSAISSESQIEIVFYHIFYPPRPEPAELDLLNAAREHDQLPDHHHFSSSSSEHAPTRNSSTDQATRTNIDPSPETPNPFLGAGADGEGGLREISVKADEKGLIIGLTCLLRQILYRAKRSSTIEVGLHLTPLYSQAPSQPHQAADEKRDPTPQEDPSLPDGSVCTSWKCVFDVSLMPPPSPRSASPQTIHDTQNNPHLPANGVAHHPTDLQNIDPEADRRASIGAQLRASATLARLRMSSNLTSELPLCPEESLSKIIFEKLLGMKLSTGRLTSSGHSWKVTGIFGKGIGRESEETDTASRKSYAGHSQASVSALAAVTPSREPTADELTKFAETALKGKKAVFFAAEQSIFAKHITTYLTSWNIDVSHMPYEKSEHDLANNASAAHQTVTETSAGVVGASAAEKTALSAAAAPPPIASSRSIRSNNFIIIDDDLTTLKAQLVKLKASPASLLHLSANVLPNHPSQRPLMSRRVKSSTQIERFEPPPKPIHTSVIHFTSISNFRKVQDIVRKHLNGVQWASIPDILVIPKPIGPRRILTALHTALSRPITEPQFVPIATSPSSPGTPHYLNSTSHPLGSSQLGRPSPANYLGVTDFDTAAENHLKNEANQGNENSSLARQPSIQNLTPPGLRTPGTAPGTPGVPSPALLSNEALEYFSKAATENGGSSSTGVVLQSPDGRPQAMFFHHSGSSNRLRNELFNHSIHGALQSSHTSGLTSSKLKLEGRNSSSRPMLREMISADPNNSEPMTLAQQVMASAEGSARTRSPSSLSNAGSNDPTTKSETSTLSNQNQNQNQNQTQTQTQNPLGQSARSNNLSTTTILGDPPDTAFPHAIALAQYEAISPRTPSLPFPEGLYAANQQRQSSGSSLQSAVQTPSPSTAPVTPNVVQTGLTPLTKEQQQILLNPRPLPMLRMPSIPANLPTSISVTLPSPRRRPMASNNNNEPLSLAKSRSSQNSPPILTHRPPLVAAPPDEPNSKTSSSGLGINEIPGVALSKSVSALAANNRRRASAGDSMMANRLGRRRVSRKPTTALVPPINVLIVEDNRINQTILTTFMRKKSVKFDVAMNGQEAVDKWRTGSFHLVLMDLQLPVKDGIEATKEIREAERSVNINAFANTPPAVGGNTPPSLVVPNTTTGRMTPHNVSVIIVALTASSLDVDREVALAAGCNDFLTKPVSLAWLEKKLLEWGSMAWLSGFSHPNIASSNPLNRSLPVSASSFALPPPAGTGTANSTSAPGFGPGPVGEKPILSFTGSLAQRKAKEVADHLYLSSDKARGTQLREKARLGEPSSLPDPSSSARDSLEHASERSGTEDEGRLPKRAEAPGGEAGDPPPEVSPRPSTIVLNEAIPISTTPDILDPARPTISLQIPTPERFDSFPAFDPLIPPLRSPVDPSVPQHGDTPLSPALDPDTSQDAPATTD
ncbi:hypothetical protein PTTG_01331 [Puccinia triticina 1-1 BBBD Race 1]|uniref:Response regulatory domain-containing protein n=1 Tax=Puccinia triticina (isolate 1-1 / race 1 (BBBD)) TaxID=630390 RepID=A0A180GZZ6_PUCT1|nr:hypothetical protein PTTG_01331 [Puccinia triticina 1-1 BBBD Race 1]